MKGMKIITIRNLIMLIMWLVLGSVFEDFLISIHHAYVAMFGCWFGYIWALVDNNNIGDK